MLGDLWKGGFHTFNGQNFTLISIYSDALSPTAQLVIHFYTFYIKGITSFMLAVIKCM